MRNYLLALAGFVVACVVCFALNGGLKTAKAVNDRLSQPQVNVMDLAEQAAK